MNVRDRLLILLVVAIWGSNFTVMKIGVGNVPPMFLLAIRYALVAFPAVLFVRRPAIEWYYSAGYALTIGVGQFGCLFYAFHIGMPAGLASVILQSQSFITVLLAALVFKEVVKARQIIGFVIAGSGLVLIGLALDHSGIHGFPVSALILTIVGAAFWSMALLIVKAASNRSKARGTKLNMFSVVVWSALVPPIPFLALSLLIESPATVLQSIRQLSVMAVFGILFMSLAATLFGTAVWNNQISKHSLGSVAPMTLLVPVMGLLVARIVLAEQMSTYQWIGSLVIIFGLSVFNLGLSPIKRISRWLRPHMRYNE